MNKFSTYVATTNVAWGANFRLTVHIEAEAEIFAGVVIMYTLSRCVPVAAKSVFHFYRVFIVYSFILLCKKKWYSRDPEKSVAELDELKYFD